MALIAVIVSEDLRSEEADAKIENLRGAEIYRVQCAQCHGADGQEVDGEYDEPLYGTRSVKALTRLIVRTMPEDEAELCVGDDAAAVAAYIHDAFYSSEAQTQLKPVKVLPARLTNRQYRESIADLVGSFVSESTEDWSERSGRRRRGRGRDRGEQSLPDEVKNATAGLRADYYESKGMNKKDKRSLLRVDQVIDFDFGEGSPAENINAEQFSIA